METALDEIAFLANSENRVAVFETLVEAPRNRDEVRDRVDASRVTIARILRELEERNWIEQSGRAYEVTPLGEWMYDEFNSLVDEMEAEQQLREALQWFPSDLLTFDVQCLRDAEIILHDASDATALIRRIVKFHRSGDRIRGIARSAAPVFIENLWEVTVHGDAQAELVLIPEALDVIRTHPPSARQFREMLAEENAHYSVYEGIPISVGIVNGAVGINLTDEEGTLKGGLKTENETVHAWAVDLFKTCREEARPVDSDTITA
ncbi:helix-turn-helix transcriptional regulator [Halomicrococcus sp. NG-SE-24]|uniref:helix-turn-helix transcriptional regulator n=1 Tax=Halomicrococcus sp. NG-SE-24 TaxID=3436928 RepID=UPI003D9574C0